ncbi:MAG: MinD/ParA family protein [Holophagales bacterium]|nr:MinD/ParA family protein [Holophagales bacterium]
MTGQASMETITQPIESNAQPLFHSRVIAITSGKGGVGKTNVVGGLALSLAKAGHRVVVLDADFGLANLDILFGLSPKYTLQNVLRGERVIEEIIVEGPYGMRLIPASNGIQQLTKLDSVDELRLIQGLQRVSIGTEWLLIDTAAGIHESVTKLLMAAQEVILVSTPEPTSLVDAYAMIKMIHVRDKRKPIWLLINNAQNQEEAQDSIEDIRDAALTFLGKSINSLGMIPSDSHILQAVRQQQGVVELFPDSPASVAFQAITETLAEKAPNDIKKDGIDAFWKGLRRG